MDRLHEATIFSKFDMKSGFRQIKIDEKDFNEKQIPTKARPTQMNNELLEHCKKKIEDLLNKGLIRKSKSPWSCATFLC